MFKNIFDKIITYNDNLTVRIRLIMLTVIGLALTMAIWGFVQLTALDRILVDQQAKRLEGVADTISTFYQFFRQNGASWPLIQLLKTSFKRCASGKN